MAFVEFRNVGKTYQMGNWPFLPCMTPASP